MIDPFVIIQNLGTISVIIQIISVMIGVVMLVGAIFQLKKYGETRSMMSQQHTLAGPLMMLVASAGLLSLPVFIDMTMMTLVGSDSPLPYQFGYGSEMNVVIVFIRVIGVGSFVRGLVLLSRTGSQSHGQPGTTGKAIIHMIAGVMCIHILGMVQLLENIFDVV